MKEVIVLDILIIILFLTATASLSIARLSINTSIDLGQEYNNNIFLDPAVKEDDFITTVFPTLELQYVRSKYLNIELEYGLRYLFYRHHSELNDTGTKETQNAQLQAQIKPSDNLLIDISDIYERVPVDIRREVAEGNVFFNKTERNTFTVSSSMTLRMTPFVTQTIGYRYINVWQGDDDLVDSESHFVYTYFNNRISSRINGTVKYEYLTYDANLKNNQDEISDYARHQGSLKIQYRLSSQLNINAQVGQSWVDFNREDDVNITFWNAGIEYSFGSSSVSVSYILSLEDSAKDGAFKNIRTDFSFVTGRAFSLTINPYYVTGKYLNVDREDEILGANLSISRSLSEKVNARLKGRLEKLSFLPEDEEVARYNAEISIDHILSRSISTNFGYTYNRSNSNIDANDYDNHIVRVKATLSL